MCKEYIIVDGYVYRKDSRLKCHEILCRSNRGKCRAKLRTDINVSNIITRNMEQNHESDSRQIERVRIKRQPQCLSN